MTAAEARTAIKNRLHISTSDFDTEIDDFVTQAIYRLWPRASKPVARQTKAVTVDDYGEATVTLSSLTGSVEGVSRVESSSGFGYSNCDSTHVSAGVLYVRQLDTSVTTLMIYGQTKYTLTNLETHLYQALYWFAMGEFYDHLAGNKTGYNVYMNGGGRAVDDMREEADIYEQKAIQYLENNAATPGVS